MIKLPRLLSPLVISPILKFYHFDTNDSEI